MTIGEQKLEEGISASFGIQQSIGFETVVEASYVTNLRRHIFQTRDLNKIPKFSQYDPVYADPSSPYTPKRNLDNAYLRPYQGWARSIWKLRGQHLLPFFAGSGAAPDDEGHVVQSGVYMG